MSQSRVLGRMRVTSSTTIRWFSKRSSPIYQSQASAASSTSNSDSMSGCPFSGGARGAAVDHPKLVKVPTLPFLGSFLSSYSGAPVMDPENFYNFNMEMRKKFGTFYSYGFPAFGQGIHGTIHAIVNPEEMLKVVRAEATYPSGIVPLLWVFKEGLREDGSALVEGNDYGLLDVGERWKKHRLFLQSGMLDPQAAKGFIPGIAQAAASASKGAPYHTDDLLRYLNYCAFDMFTSFMFGDLTEAASGIETKDEESKDNLKFCKAAVAVMDHVTPMVRSPYQLVMHKMGIKTKAYKEWKAQWDIVRVFGKKKLEAFMKRYEKDELTELERLSYFANALRRFEEGNSGLSKAEVVDMCLFSMFVGVDTTSNVTAWNLMHIAMNPEIQDKLYKELSENVKATGGILAADMLRRDVSPYLHMIMRESNRITPPIPQVLMKSLSQKEVEVHGITFPAGTVFGLEAVGYDPNFVTDAHVFKPERWSAEAIEARKGTKEAVIDHALYRDPFGQGARRCPGSRVATNEVMCMISQLVLDYRIESPVSDLKDIKTISNPFVTPVMPKLKFTARN
jgi:cytochrome P450